MIGRVSGQGKALAFQNSSRCVAQHAGNAMKPMSLQDSMFMVLEGRQQPMHVATVAYLHAAGGRRGRPVQQIFRAGASM